MYEFYRFNDSRSTGEVIERYINPFRRLLRRDIDVSISCRGDLQAL